MIAEIEGSSPQKFTSQITYRDYLNVEDIEGARPMVMKGYSGKRKQYERYLDSQQLSRLPYAGESRKALRGK